MKLTFLWAFDWITRYKLVCVTILRFVSPSILTVSQKSSFWRYIEHFACLHFPSNFLCSSRISFKFISKFNFLQSGSTEFNSPNHYPSQSPITNAKAGQGAYRFYRNAASTKFLPNSNLPTYKSKRYTSFTLLWHWICGLYHWGHKRLICLKLLHIYINLRLELDNWIL
jgi:hypothetical protein